MVCLVPYKDPLLRSWFKHPTIVYMMAVLMCDFPFQSACFSRTVGLAELPGGRGQQTVGHGAAPHLTLPHHGRHSLRSIPRQPSQDQPGMWHRYLVQ